ncbi:DNA primase domain-containing protein [Rhizobium phage RHph_X2_24]|nr:DNA primase domain-containing protein [Rhizobium phage RHph_X2_24]
MQDYSQAAAYVHALTGEPVETAALWWRAIHDTDKAVSAHKIYGTLAEVWNTLCSYNSNGYGIFCNINAFLPTTETHNLADVWYIRTHVVDLDNTLTSQQNYQRAASGNPAPCFAVGTSPNKYHIYWPTPAYQGNERYNTLQRKLRQVFDGDKSIIDPTRVLRVPGFLHLKNPQQPHLVSCWSLPGYLQRQPIETMEAAFAHVNVIDGAGGRHELGDPALAAPSLDWLRYALSLIDPNNLDRGEWISTTAAFKQSGYTLATEQQLFDIWSEWCGRYAGNDAGENHKQWHSIRDTEVGWKSFYRRVPTLQAYEQFGFKQDAPKPVEHQPQPQPSPTPDAPADVFPDILSDVECREYFRNCYFVEKFGQILTPRGMMNATQFNGAYGGKLFVITPDGKTTDEPWKAALRSTLWTVPKVNRVRFTPDQPSYSIVEDELARKGVNTYVPARIAARPGDVTPWLRHMELMFPVEADRLELYRYFAHAAKFPGFKIPWAPLIQSGEGTGKTALIQETLMATVGSPYVYSPKADELVNSGSKFNAWMRNKLLIIVNEIKVDERRELVEILKPMITDKRIEIQAKGVDQDIEDNPANWVFFTNYKDAIPVSINGRRYAIFYSVLQSKDDLLARGMNDDYFNALFMWFASGGSEHIAHWLLNYPVERGQIPMRAPETSSSEEAIRVSRGPYETAIINAVADGLPGFRGGYVSLLAVMNRLRNLGGRQPTQRTVQTILETMGYHDCGRASRQYGQESMTERTTVYALLRGMDVAAFGRVQGYE